MTYSKSGESRRMQDVAASVVLPASEVIKAALLRLGLIMVPPSMFWVIYLWF